WGTTPGVYTGRMDAVSSPARLDGLDGGTAYYVRVITVDEACNEAPGAEVSAVTAADCGGPLCPSGVGGSLRGVKAATLDVALSWAPGPVDVAHGLATSFEVWRSGTRPQDGYAPIAAAPSPAFVDAGAAGPSAPAPRLFYRIV